MQFSFEKLKLVISILALSDLKSQKTGNDFSENRFIQAFHRTGISESNVL